MTTFKPVEPEHSTPTDYAALLNDWEALLTYSHSEATAARRWEIIAGQYAMQLVAIKQTLCDLAMNNTDLTPLQWRKREIQDND